MKIVYVSPYNHGGAHSGQRVRTTNICMALRDDPTNEVVCLSPWTPPEGVEHHHFSLDGGWLRRLCNLPILNLKLLVLRPDIVISESPLAPFSFGRFKVIHVIHDAKFLTTLGRRGSGIVRRMHWLSARIACRVLTVSRAESDRIAAGLGIPPRKIVVSYNGISPQWMTPLPTHPAIVYDLIYVSNFARHKGHQRLLEAIDGLGLKVLLVGADFGERTTVLDYARARGLDVTVREGISDEDLVALYDASRVFVFPSALEGFGIPYVEARARGLPVIAQDIPVFRELQAEIGGTIVTFDEHEQVREALASANDETRERPDMAPFSWPALTEKLLGDILA